MDKDTTTKLVCMEKILGQQRKLQEQMQKYLEPQLKLQEHMQRYLEPQRKLQEKMQKYLEPQLKLQEQMQKYLEPQLKLQEHMQRYLEPQRKLQEKMQKYLEPQLKLQEHMQKFLEPQRKLQEQLQKYFEPQQLLQDQITKYIQPLNDYLSNPLMEKIALERDGSISVSDEIIDTEVVSKKIEELSNNYSNTQDFLEHFFNWLEKLGHATRVAVIYLILPYFLAIIANLTTPFYEEWWKEYVDLDQRGAKKEIIREANEFYSPKELSEYRFVYATILHVRNLGNKNSEIIDELYLGKTIRVIKKLKRWTLVEYHDSESKNTRQGWVYSRYLQKFNK